MSVYYDCITFRDPVKEGGKKRAIRIGSAKQRDDGGFQVYLDALPLGGQFAILPQQQREQGQGTTAQRRPAKTREDDDEIPF